jgi:hypothetical protein
MVVYISLRDDSADDLQCLILPQPRYMQIGGVIEHCSQDWYGGDANS